ncbi:MAG: glycosyl hydrolase [Bacteroidetes bacterium]|nr:MAG: glycosyl hydrolase [Bacteroidota bacterium]
MRFIFSITLLFSALISQGQAYVFPTNQWVDSVYQNLSREERVGQLIMAAAYSDANQDNTAELEALIQHYRIGGLIFFKGSPMRQANMTNYLQAQSPIPLMIGIDAEWGLNMRLDSTLKYPRQMALAAFDDDSLIYRMGFDIAQQCKRLGIHVNFAPVVDVNNNANNPVINDRSWGENKWVVIRKSNAYMQGMQDAGIIACIKHFPGHGDTETDSHKDLPLLDFSYERLDSLELVPFRALIDSGAMSVMAAHLYVEALDTTPNLPSSLSRPIIHGLLQDSMGFKGLVFTDALNMHGVKKHFKGGEIAVKALQAGNDILLFPEDVPLAIQAVITALDSCEIDSLEFEHSVKKVLASKYKLGLNRYKPIDTASLYQDLHDAAGLHILDETSERQITVVRRHKHALPLPKDKKIACLAIGERPGNQFHQAMNRYGKYDYFSIDRNASDFTFAQLKKYLLQERYDLIVVSIHNTNRLVSRMYGLSAKSVLLVEELDRSKSEVVLVSFGIPYNLRYFKDLDNIVVAYQDIDLNMEKAAAAIHGHSRWEAKLPITVNEELEAGLGVERKADTALLNFSNPQRLDFSMHGLSRIDSLIEQAIRDSVLPGCQVLVAQQGRVLFNKSFGHHTYEANSKVVSETDIYDLASVTKVAATTMAIMHLYDKGKIDLKKKASFYVKALRGTNKSNITLQELLTHTAGLQSWIPFYLKTLDSTGAYYSFCRDDDYCIPVAQDQWANRRVTDSIWSWIVESPVKKPGHYLYSDLSFYLLQKVVESFDKEGLDHYVSKNIYEPLNLANLAYSPLEHFNHDRIVPTEKDSIFRRQTLLGYVHDPGAAMLGGVGGHAGLFGNAGDLAILMQCLLNKGHYGNVKLFSENTVYRFSRYDNVLKYRRGLGFDKPEPDPKKGTPCSRCASLRSYGHSGFTGTFVWVDPEYDLIYIFLSNRVYPDAANNRISKTNLRTHIQSIIYQEIGVDCKYEH